MHCSVLRGFIYLRFAKDSTFKLSHACAGECVEMSVESEEYSKYDKLNYTAMYIPGFVVAVEDKKSAKNAKVINLRRKN